MDARYNRTARLSALKQRVEALEQINAQRGVSKPAQTDQAQAIRFMVANMDVIAEMIEKYSATVVGSLKPRRRGMRQIDRSWRNQQRTE